LEGDWSGAPIGLYPPLEVTMVSDDLTAIAAISMGALTSSALTMAVMLSLRVPASPAETLASEPDEARGVASYVVPCAREPVVDFAIIREGGELIVGPENARSGWSPPASPQLRLLLSR
jgi:hypothetical protein